MELIVAIDQHGSIGDSSDGRMCWKCPEDLENFRITTTGHIVIMGRKTFDSLKAPLSNRINIVLTRHFYSISDAEAQDNQVIYTGMDGLFDVINQVKTEDRKVFVIGGAEIYRLLFPYVTVAHLTLIGHAGKVGDTAIPEEILHKISGDAGFTMIYNSNILSSKIEPNTYEFMRFEKK
jgi:dihydrofolate reductase